MEDNLEITICTLLAGEAYFKSEAETYPLCICLSRQKCGKSESSGTGCYALMIQCCLYRHSYLQDLLAINPSAINPSTIISQARPG